MLCAIVVYPRDCASLGKRDLQGQLCRLSEGKVSPDDKNQASLTHARERQLAFCPKARDDPIPRRQERHCCEVPALECKRYTKIPSIRDTFIDLRLALKGLCYNVIMNTDNDIEMVINRAERKDEVIFLHSSLSGPLYRLSTYHIFFKIKYLVKYRDKPHSSNKWVHSVRVPSYLIREFREVDFPSHLPLFNLWSQNPPDIDVVALVYTRRRGGVLLSLQCVNAHDLSTGNRV